MDTQLTWVNDRKISPEKLILEELLPMARHGLEKNGIDKADIDTYLGIIEARARSGQTGSAWMLNSFSRLAKEGVPRDEIISTITASMNKQQHQAKPIHEWEPATLDMVEYEPSAMLVEEFMKTDLITVQENDILDLPASLMDWRKLRHVAVEDDEGKLVGLLTSRMILREYARRKSHTDDASSPTVGSIMRKNPITIGPEDTIVQAMELMTVKEVGCLPVLNNGKLIGMITEGEFLEITRALMHRLVRKRK